MRYTSDLGCRFRGIPHDMKMLGDNPKVKIEQCLICRKKFRWMKGFKGRIKNEEYLKAHVRVFAQRSGLTKRIFAKIYQPESLVIKI